MLTELHIQNFRLFEDFQLSNLAPVNLIVGKNNVGKSTLLEAIQLLVSHNSPEVLFEQLEMKGELFFQESSFRSEGYKISHLFFDHQLPLNSSLDLKAKNAEEQLFRFSLSPASQQLKLVNSPNGEKKHVGPFELTLSYEGENKYQTILPVFGETIDKREAERSARLAFVPSRQCRYMTTRTLDYQFLARLWDSITLTAKEDQIIQMLNILEPDVQRVSFQSRLTANSGILIKLRNQSQPLPLGNMGEGMHRMLALATVLVDTEKGYLLVDEIDTGFHYRLLTDMWHLLFEIASRLQVQIFATTHSWDCVVSFAEALDSQPEQSIATLFRLERRGKQIVAVNYDASDLIFATEQDVEVR